MQEDTERLSASEDPGRGSRRHARYREAFGRALRAQRDGYFLEGIAIIDSLISDRLASRLGYRQAKRPSEFHSCGVLCAKLLDKDVEKDPEFREAIERIREWVQSRNHALHATAKALPREDGQSFEQLVEAHRDVLVAGIKHLQAFDVLDSADRVANGARSPATAPNAFDIGSGRPPCA